MLEAETLKKENEEKKVSYLVNNSFSNDEILNGDTLEQIDKKNKENTKVKNLISVVIVLSGLFVGSLFIDFIQLFSGSGYSERALKKAEIFESDGKTWVAFNDPIVELKVIVPKEEDLKNCSDCDPTEVLTWIKKFLPTLLVKKVSVDSVEGKKLVDDLKIVNIPAFIFDSKIKKTDFYNQEGVSSVFSKKNNFLVLNKSIMGIPAGKYLIFPDISSDDKILGNENGLQIITFIDFQCPYSKKLFSSIQELLKDGYQEKLKIVFKNLPDTEIYPLSEKASEIAFCAGKQDKFWEMAKLLFDKQEQWNKAKDASIFASYYPFLKLDSTKMKDCLSSQETKTKLETDKKQAEMFNLVGTPSGFIGNELFGGALDKNSLKNIIDKQL